MTKDRQDHEETRAGPGILTVFGLGLFLCGLGMGIAASVAFVDERLVKVPGLDGSLPLMDRSDPLIAIVLVVLGVVLIAVDSGRGRDRA